MTNLAGLLSAAGAHTIAGVAEGWQPWLVADALAATPVPLVIVARQDRRAQEWLDILPQLTKHPVFSLPAWDCLPYDRVSPHADITAQRMATLAALAGGHATPVIVVTTVNALLQKLPPRAMLAQHTAVMKVGTRCPLSALPATLVHHGYHSTATVREPGEFAVRGGLVDIFPVGRETPLRLDFFGDTLESMRGFDPVTQMTDGTTARELALLPVREVILTPDTIARFRQEYKKLAGGRVEDDALYNTISAGHYAAGVEHWLPLFYEKLDTLAEYLPGAAYWWEPQADSAIAARREHVQDYYAARQEALRQPKTSGTTRYYPVPPASLFLDSPPASATAPTLWLGEHPAPTLRLDSQEGYAFVTERQNPATPLYQAVRQHAASLQKRKIKVVVAAYSVGSRDRLAMHLQEGATFPVVTAESWAEAIATGARVLPLVALPLARGFVAPALAVITEGDILGERLNPRRKSRKASALLTDAASLQSGDYVVHTDHGIGQYDGLETLHVDGIAHDCLRVCYAGGDKLFVPVENMDVLSRFGGQDAPAQLDKLGGVAWQARKAAAEERIKAIAAELLAVAAARATRQGLVMQPDGAAFDAFCSRFPYAETEDQLSAIQDVLTDLGQGKPMDRLVCGDVGFGKTEVALRAAFVAAAQGAQVAVITPTTLLARQHYHEFARRFDGFPMTVKLLSRMVSAKDAAATRSGLADGRVDIVVGTHALLASSVQFKRLGLVIVDEEQRFGVAHKEKLKALKTDVHVLTLTATPIPRTLQMALHGVRDLSLIATPPVDRLAVRTFAMPFDDVIIRDALLREHFRGGQSFVVCPHISDLSAMHSLLRQLVPDVRLAVAHGQLPPAELDALMTAFTDKQYDVLLATNIIESGIDIPNANTLIIHRADRFGLAQLYQLRGRVGRGKIRGYAYLTFDGTRPLTVNAEKRLEVMRTLDHLGAGFTLASHDMDIRGAGNLLGDEQSGHIKDVGVELYQHLLENAIATAKALAVHAPPPVAAWVPQLNLGLAVQIPDSYVRDLDTRMSLYQRIAHLPDAAAAEAFAVELIDRFGRLPVEAENLLTLVDLKRQCREAGVAHIDAGAKGIVVGFHKPSLVNPAPLLDFVTQAKGAVKLRPDEKLVFLKALPDANSRLAATRQVLGQLRALALTNS